MGARVEDELREVLRAVPLERRHHLAYLQRVADSMAQWLIHVGEQADDLAALTLPEIDHLLGEDSRIVHGLHEWHRLPP